MTEPVPTPDIHFLTWDPVCQRSESLAQELGRSLETIHYLAYRKPALAPLKYPPQWVKTLVSLRRRAADVIVVSNPPPFAALAVAQHCKLSGTDFVIDAHTGVFLEAKWRPFLPLNRALMRRALLTLVTNEPLRRVVEGWGANAFVLPDPLPELRPDDGSFDLDESKFNVAAIFSFYEDEPIEEMLTVSGLPSDTVIHVTGDARRVPHRLQRQLSPNVRLTGFLPRRSYESLLHRCDAVAVFCTKPHTLLCGAYEAVAAGKPLLTSRSEAMESYFRAGTVYVDNSAAAIARGLEEVRARRDELTADMQELGPRLRSEWAATFRDCLETIATERQKRAAAGAGATLWRGARAGAR